MANEVRILVTASDRASGPMSNVQKAAQRMGEAVRTATLVSGAALVGLGGASIKFASDLSESMNKVDVVFGDSAEAVKEFTRTAARELGVSQARALEATGTFGNLFVTMGLGQEDAANMSTELATLAADLASFNNIDPTEALDKLRAGLVGEVEPLRTVGVALNAAAVEAEAMRLGLVAAGEEMSEADKVQARYSLILQQTTTAQGDFARTSDGMANGLRIFRAQLEDLAAKMGTVLLPVAQQVLGALIDKLDDLTEWFEANRPQIEAALEEISRVFMNFAGTFKRGLEVVLPALGNFAEFIYRNKPILIAAIVAIGAAIVLAFGPVSIAIAAITGMITAIGYFRDNWRQVAIDVLGFVQKLSDGITDFANSIIDKIGDAIEFAINPLLEAASKVGIGGGAIEVFEGGGLERSNFAPGLIESLRAGMDSGSAGDSDVFDDEQEAGYFARLAAKAREATTAIGEQGLTGAATGAKAAADAMTAAEKELADQREKLFSTINRIQNDFMHEQIAAYLEGGEGALEAVRDQQDAIREEMSAVAEDLRDKFGIDLADSLDIAFEHVTSGVDSLTGSAKEFEEQARRARESFDALMARQAGVARDELGSINAFDFRLDETVLGSGYSSAFSGRAESLTAAVTAAQRTLGRGLSDAESAALVAQYENRLMSPGELTPTVNVYIGDQQLQDVYVEASQSASAYGVA